MAIVSLAAHRHPAVRLSACRPARRRRRGRQEMTATTTTPVVPPRSAWRPRERTSSKEAQRLLPRPLLVVITIVLCVIVVVPASVHRAGLGEQRPRCRIGRVLAQLVLPEELRPDLDHGGPRDRPREQRDRGRPWWPSRPPCSGRSPRTCWCATRSVGRLTILRGLLGLQSIPGTLMLLPVFVLFASAANYLGIQVIGTRWGLFITYLTFALPFSTWVMVTYLRGLPRELEEAARVDGASILAILLRIIMPLSWPGDRRVGHLRVPAGLERRALRLGDDPARDAGPPPWRCRCSGRPRRAGRSRCTGQMMAAALVCAAAGRSPVPRLPALPGRRPDRRRSQVT